MSVSPDDQAGPIDPAEVRRAIQESRALTLRTVNAPHEFIQRLEGALDVCLDTLGQGGMKEGLFFCLQELVGNAKKANNKRVYFREKGLDITDAAQYERGMKAFREEVFARVEYYHRLMVEQGYHIDVTIQRRPAGVELTVANNIEMTAREHARVYDRIARSRAFGSVEEAFASVLDSSEGAGLGLTIVLLYLRKLGLREEVFDLESRKSMTAARLSIPFSEVHLAGLEAVSSRVLEEVDRLPTFPEHILELQKLLDDAAANFPDIAKLISRDPAFTADLLRYVNSAQFVLNRRVENVVDAVRVAGLRFLRNMLFSYGSQKILADRYPQMRQLWVHSQRVAFYAYHLARSILKDRRLADDVYVAGILHDMGKIVMDFLYPRIREALEDFARDRRATGTLVEAISFGVSHARIGAQVARKWHFPEVFVAGIDHHHEPAEGGEHREVVDTVYLANLLAREDVVGVERIEVSVLKRFGIQTDEQLDRVRGRLVEAYTGAYGAGGAG